MYAQFCNTWQTVIRSLTRRTKRTVAFTKLSIVSTLLVTASFVPIIAFTGTAHADTNCTPGPTPPPANISLSGSSWLNGGGVNICYNGGNANNDYGDSCFTMTGGTGGENCGSGTVYLGEDWQCVELVNRLYFTRGWLTSVLSGNGNTIINDVHNHSGLSSENDGSISYLNPGDVITLDDGGFGHAGVIDSIGSGTYPINIKNQNADLSSSAKIGSGSLSGSNADLEMSGWATYSVQAIIHHPSASTTSRPAAVQNGSSEMDVYKTGGDGNVYKDTWNGTSWSGFSSLGGGNLTSAPFAVVFGSEMDVYATGSDGNVYKDTWNGSSWGGFSSLGSGMSGDPSSVVYGSEMDVYAHGTDGNVYKDTWNGSSWSGFNSLGGSGNLQSNPASLVYGSEMDVYARSSNGNINKDTWNGTSWSGFNSLSGSMAGNPNAIQFNSEMDVYTKASGTNGALEKDTWNGSSWSGWNSLGGGLPGDPFALAYSSSEMDVYVRGTTGAIYKQTWNGSSWSGYNSLGGTMSGDPIALKYNSEMDVFAIGTDGNLYKDTWNGSSWSGWNSLG